MTVWIGAEKSSRDSPMPFSIHKSTQVRTKRSKLAWLSHASSRVSVVAAARLVELVRRQPQGMLQGVARCVISVAEVVMLARQHMEVVGDCKHQRGSRLSASMRQPVVSGRPGLRWPKK